jgi:hypothetical protein
MRDKQVRLLQRRLEKRDLEIFHLRRCQNLSLYLSRSLSRPLFLLSLLECVNACMRRLEELLNRYRAIPSMHVRHTHDIPIFVFMTQTCVGTNS